VLYCLFLLVFLEISLVRMIKRMTDRIGHFGHPKQSSDSSPRGLGSLPYTPSPAIDISIAADYHRGSISTARTSSSEWSKRGDSFEAEPLPPPSLPRVSSRPKASYRLSDFMILRTLGTGSFGRVHLGQFLDLSVVVPSHQ
jgi:protein kinase A